MSLRIVFMGTPEFAVPSLRRLLEEAYEVVGVITAPDKMGGRGKKQRLESAVKRFARQKGLRVLQPKNLKDPHFLEELRSLGPQLQVVVAFRMLPRQVWNMPELGTINLHASLLPKYRGAAPINWAIIRGEHETGLTTFFINEQIDTGDMLRQLRVPIRPDDTAGDLHDRLMAAGSDLLLQTVQAIERGEAKPVPQAHREATPAPKIYHDTCRIDFDQPTGAVYNFIRGMSPYPGAWTTLDGKEFKILEARPVSLKHPNRPGNLLTDNKQWMHIATQDGAIEAQKVKMEGRRAMAITDFLNGYDLSASRIG